MYIYHRVIASLPDPTSDDIPLIETADDPVFEPANPGLSSLQIGPERYSIGFPVENYPARQLAGYRFLFWNVTLDGRALAEFPNPSPHLSTTAGDTATAWYEPDGPEGPPRTWVRAFDGDHNQFRRMTPIAAVKPAEAWPGPNRRDVSTERGPVAITVKDMLDSRKALHRWLVARDVVASGPHAAALAGKHGLAVVSYKQREDKTEKDKKFRLLLDFDPTPRLRVMVSDPGPGETERQKRLRERLRRFLAGFPGILNPEYPPRPDWLASLQSGLVRIEQGLESLEELLRRRSRP